MYVAAPVVDDKTFFKDLTFPINLEDTTRSGSQLWNQDLPGFNGEDTTCDALLARLKANNHVDSNTFRRFGEAEGSDVYYDIHTTRLVPITFLKGRVASHYFEYLNQPYRFSAAYRLDSSINHHLDQMMQDTTIWPLMAWMGTIDEPHLGTFQLHRILASKIQRRMLYNHPTDQSKWRGIWANTLGGTGTLRVLAGDFDSTSHKPMSVVITHSYPMSTALPAYYANKDSMNPATFEQYFNKYPYDTVDDKGNPTSLSGYGGATHFPSTPEAHALYTKYLVGVNPVDHGSWCDTSVGGLMIKMRVNKADVIECQFKFEHLGRPKIPVYQNIQMAGYLKYKEEGFPGFAGKWDFPGAQQRTPEQVTAQGWLTLNCGSQGMMVSDMHTTGPHLGIFTNYGTNPLLPENPRIPNDTLYHYRIKDYDTLRLDDVREYLQRSVDSIPTIYLGYRQRFNAIRKITSAIKRLDTLYTKLQYNPA
ncbi:MAG: hypothetical protein IT211_02160 [Armatimonadetes bacterium]|nr:hypothetical protein [Armatimonadota bacterium]